MKIARKVPRPTGIILISFFKLAMIVSLIIGLLTIVARYNIKLLKMEILKNSLIDREYIMFFLQEPKNRRNSNGNFAMFDNTVVNRNVEEKNMALGNRIGFQYNFNYIYIESYICGK